MLKAAGAGNAFSTGATGGAFPGEIQAPEVYKRSLILHFLFNIVPEPEMVLLFSGTSPAEALCKWERDKKIRKRPLYYTVSPEKPIYIYCFVSVYWMIP